MKKILTTLLLFTSLNLQAQNSFDINQLHNIPNKFVEIGAMLSIMYLITSFIIKLIKLILDHRLKSKMIEKGVSEGIVAQLVDTHKKDAKSTSLKWFITLLGIGIGLTLVSLFPALGIHSIIIMIFSIACSFLAYYYFEKSQELHSNK